MVRGDDPFKVLAKVRANTYKLELPGDTTISYTFNTGDLSPSMEDEVDCGDLMVNPFKEGEDDACQHRMRIGRHYPLIT